MASNPTVSPLVDVFLAWGESARWDERRQRLYCVDCATNRLCWLEEGRPPLHSMPVPSLPTGMALTGDDRLVLALDDGLHVVDTERRTTEALATYPEGLGRANDLNADLDGNLVTGTLNLAGGPGSYWWFSSRSGWVLLDEGIGNANGPVVLEVDGRMTLVFADTTANRIYAYDYDGRIGRVGQRRTLSDTTELGGAPDGACADGQAGVWSCILGPGRVVRLRGDRVDCSVDVGVSLPSDVTFGGPDLDRMFVTSIASGTDPASASGGQVVLVEGTGFTGRPEPRFVL
ncbi:MAG TPA: SMP-30/gluconolactonase/LRE family protein [Acidimicrobiales bacterium]|nr:SMP-30/gluconolactonase/LRE family protein [Acidimicrobiales bacterium]